MRYVYILRSLKEPDRHYVGSTIDLRKRFAQHNAGESKHTAKFRPWQLATYIAFSKDDKADKFERYLKSGSGRTFSRRHF
jgi:putative endonuclease